MFHSILITDGNQALRLEAFTKLTKLKPDPNPDFIILNPEPSITIKLVRELESFLSKKPYAAKLKTVLILEADKITAPAQHALLKTLEEPPANSQIFLLCQNQSNLLTTITSRCQIIKIKADLQLDKAQIKTQQELFKSITNSSLGQRVNLASQLIKNKKEALDFCGLQIQFLKPSLKKHSHLVKKLLTATSQLNANVNPKLVIENLLFSYPSISKN